MLVVDYDAVDAYQRAGRLNLFVVFKTIIVGIYLLAMLGEGKEIVNLGQWVLAFPSLPAGGVQQRTAHEEESIEGITSVHRMTMAFLTVARMVMLFILTWVG